MQGAPASFASVVLVAALLSIGCGSQDDAVDEAPFRQAIERYLESHNMALSIKEIKEGPLVSDREARLQASMTHRELKGPSVTWMFFFNQSPTGEWTVVRHED